MKSKKIVTLTMIVSLIIARSFIPVPILALFDKHAMSTVATLSPLKIYVTMSVDIGLINVATILAITAIFSFISFMAKSNFLKSLKNKS